MIKRIFVFTDMQFDASQYSVHHYHHADAVDWETNHDVIERAYKEAGYEMPQIRCTGTYRIREITLAITAPVTGEQKGVALLNGFSPSLLKVFTAWRTWRRKMGGRK